MAKILIYNNDTNRMETYYRDLNEAMPYVTGRTLTVREFRGSSSSNTLWSEKRVMQSWNSFRYIWGQPIYVGFAFKRIWEGGHGRQSQHYAGTAFDVGQNLSYSKQAVMRQTAINSGVWSYVEPVSLSPRWVHFDKRRGTPACYSGGYPLVANGSRGAYVLIAQDALNALGYNTYGLDGIFGNNTRNATIAFQRAYGLTQDGVIGCNTWTQLTGAAVGIDRTSTVVD